MFETSKGVRIDFDLSRTKDMDRMRNAQKDLQAIGEKFKGINLPDFSYADLAQGCLDVTKAIIGEEEMAKIETTADNWEDCLALFVDVAAYAKKAQDESAARVSKYDIKRLLS